MKAFIRLLVLAGFAQLAVFAAVAAGRDFELLSINAGDTASGNGASLNPVVSSNGRFVAFASEAANLVANDNNRARDVFWRDRVAGTTRLVSRTPAGASGNAASDAPVISPDGRYVAFHSRASNLVPNDNNADYDVFLWDSTDNSVTLVSRTPTGGSGAGASYSPQLSTSGRVVSFASTAADLVAHDTNGTADAFARDLDLGVTYLASVNTNGFSGNGSAGVPVLSANGRYVAFLSRANDLVTNDFNSLNDVFVHDLQTRETKLVSVNVAGTGAGNRLSFDPVISADGRYIAFSSQATNLVTLPDENNFPDVFVRDMQLGVTKLVSVNAAGTAAGGNGGVPAVLPASFTPFLSADGTKVLFASLAADLVANDTNGKQDVFLRDHLNDTTTLISTNRYGTGAGNAASGLGAYSMSADLRYVAFFSEASDVGTADTNGRTDVFLRDLTTSATKIISRVKLGGLAANGHSFQPVISADGSTILFTSEAENLDNRDANAQSDVFAAATTLGPPDFGVVDVGVSITSVSARTVGSPFTLTITVTNHSPAPATGLVVGSSASDFLERRSATVSQGTLGNHLWVVGDLAANGSATATVSLVATNLGAGNVSVTLTGGDQLDSNLNNNSALSTVTANQTAAGALFYLPGNTPYLSRTNSPFFAGILSGAVTLEDFERGAFNIAGVTASAGQVVGPGGQVDSVDADDGVVDGSGNGGHSYLVNETNSVTFSFNAALLGRLPTKVGIVLTDGYPVGSGIEAFDTNGVSLGVVGPVQIGDDKFTGETAEDRFLGVEFAGGISALRVFYVLADFEVDHLQFDIPTTDLQLTGTAPESALVGAFFTTTLSVTNLGPVAVTRVVVTNADPGPIQFMSAVASQGAFDGETGTWTVGGLAVGEGATLTLTLAPTTVGELQFYSRVASEVPDRNTANDLVIATVLVPNQPPVLTFLTSPVFVLEDAGLLRAVGFASFSGPEPGQTLASVTVTNDNPALFAVQPTLDLNGLLTFRSAANANGSATITVIAQDDGGTANGGVDRTTNTFVITVLPVNDAPVLTFATNNVVVLEDAAAQTLPGFVTASVGPADEAGQSVTNYTVTASNPGMFAVAPAVALNGTLTFTLAANANGSATITVTAQDDGGTVDGGVNQTTRTFTLTVTPVNDAPVLTFATNNLVVIEDAAAQTAPGFVTASVGPADEAGQSITNYTVTSSVPGMFAVAPAVALNGTLTFTPAANSNGSATITVIAQDDGGTANGGVDRTTNTFVITVLPVNDAPVLTFATNNLVVLEDAAAQALPRFVTASVGPADEAGQSITNYTVTSSAPGMFAVAPAVALNGTLTFTLAANSNGVATITVAAQDDGGTADGGVNQTTSTFTITVTPVNDAPSIVLSPPTITALEDSGPQTVPGFASAIVGPPNEADQRITNYTLTVSSPVPGLFAAGPSLALDGTLTYTLAANANGLATVTVVAQDDGGTVNGGVDRATNSFAIIVTPVNDAPTLTFTTNNLVVLEDAGAQSRVGFVAASVGPANEAGQSVTNYTVTSSVPGLFAVAPAVALNGTLTFTPAANSNGSATITVIAQDDGGTANGGVDRTTNIFVITVTPVNDAPSFTFASNTIVVLEDAGAVTLANQIASTATGPVPEPGQAITNYIVTTTNTAFFTVQPALDVAGTLTFTLAPDVNGTAYLQVQAQDDGDPANGGTNGSAPVLLTLSVTPVNDAPTVAFTKNNQVVLEDVGAQTFTAFATFAAVEAGQAVTNATAANSNPALFAVQPYFTVDGTLRFTPAANANGVATVTVIAQDDGGTANGGVDRGTNTFTITVTPVNDAPSFAFPPWATWTARETNRNWRGIASSADGTKLAAVEYGGRIYTSTDSGIIWTAQETNRNWYAIASSSDGTKLVASDYYDDGNGRLYTSTDSGVTWTLRESGSEWISIASSADGVKLAAVPQIGRIITSTNSGVTWTTRENRRNWRAIASSSDGTKLAAAAAYGRLYTSTDSGVTWTARESDRSWTAIASSADGVKLVAADKGAEGGGLLYTSADSGVTWTARESGRQWTSVASSADGVKLAAVAAFERIYLSADSGVTWEPQEASRYWFSVAASADGGKLAAIERGGQIYTAPEVTVGYTITVLEDSGAYVGASAVRNILSGPADEAGQAVSLTITTANPALFSVQPALDAAGTLTFTPATNANGATTVTVVAQDNGGTNDQGVDKATNTFTISITPVNDVPVLAFATNKVVVLEDAGERSVAGFVTASVGPADESGQTITNYSVVVTDAALFTVQPAVALDGTLTFTLAPNANGTATVTVIAQDDGGTADGGGDSGTEAFTITVTPVNDAPSFTLRTNFVAALEDAGLVTVPSLVSSLSVGPADEAGQAVTNYVVTVTSNATLFAVAPALALNGTLTFTPAANANGVALVSVQAQDDGGTANGGTNGSALVSLSIGVTAVNDTPTAALNLAVFNAGRGGGTGDGLLVGGSTYYPAAGATVLVAPDLTYSNTISPTTAGAQVSLDNGQPGDVLGWDTVLAGSLGISGVYSSSTRVLSFTGTATTEQYQAVLRSVTYRNATGAPDDDRTVSFNVGLNTLYSPSTGHFYEYITDRVNWATARSQAAARTFHGMQGYLATVTSQAENDFILNKLQADSWIGASDAASEGATETNWRWVTGPEAGQQFSTGSVSFLGRYQHWNTGEPNNLMGEGYAEFYTTGFWNDLNGTQLLPYVVEYGGLAGDPVVSLSLTGSRLISYYPILQVAEDAGPQTFLKAVTNLSVGPANEAGQTLTFSVTNDNGSLFGTPPALDASGTLTFTSAPDAFGVAQVTVIAQDDGGTADGGVNRVTNRFTLLVTPINDRPTFDLRFNNVGVAEDNPLTVFDVGLMNFSPGPANEAGQTLLGFVVTNSNPALFAVQPTLDTAGKLRFQGATNATGTVTLGIFALDNGGTDDGGTDRSLPRTFTIILQQRNDAPSFTLATNLVSVREDAGPVTLAGFIATSSVGPAQELGLQAITNYAVTTPDTQLFVAQPAISTNGTLTFTAAADTTGTTTVTVIARDNGGTGNSGTATSAPQTFTLTIRPVNTAPSFTFTNFPATDGTQDWVRDATTGVSTGVKVVTDAQGNVIVAGDERITGEITTYQVRLVKYSNGGTTLWNTTIAGEGFFDSVQVKGLALDSAGAVIVLADYTAGQTHDYLTVKFNADAALVWSNRFDGGGVDVPMAVAVDGKDNVIVTGSSETNRYTDYLTLKYLPDGTPSWTNRSSYADSGNDVPRSVAVDAAGDVYVTGDGSVTGSTYAYTVKLAAATGDLVWTNQFDRGGANGTAEAVRVDGGGNVIVAGTLNDPFNQGQFYFAVVKYTGAGAVVWTNLYARNMEFQHVHGLAVDSAGNVFLTGNTQEEGNMDFSTLKYLADGTPAWTNHYDGLLGGRDHPNAIAVNAAGEVFVTGESVGANGSDFLTVKYTAAGVGVWTNRYNGSANGADFAYALATDAATNVFVTGVADNVMRTIKYAYTPSPGADQTVLQSVGAVTVPNFIATRSAGPANESAQTLSFMVVTDNPGLFTVQPAISAAGVLTYTVDPAASGLATVTVRAQDDGGTADGGVDTSATQTFNLTVLSGAGAVFYVWLGGTGDWNDPANWTPRGVPGVADTATMASGTAVLTNTVTVAHLTLDGGTLGGAGSLTIRSSMNWNGGVMSGAGTTTIAVGATLAISGAAEKNLNRRLDNRGTVTWTDAAITNSSGSIINNYPGALFHLQTDAPLFAGGSGTRTFNNSGTVLKSVATGTSTIAGTFNNTGALEIRSGLVSLTGDYAPGAGSSLKVYLGGLTAGTQFGQLQVGGTATLNGTLNIVLANSFLPVAANTFLVVSSGTRAGTFATVSGDDLGGGLRLVPTYALGDLTLVATDLTPGAVPPMAPHVDGGGRVIRWPAGTAGYELQTATAITGPWTPVLTPVALEGRDSVVRLSTEGTRFYRLVRPTPRPGDNPTQ